MIYKHSKMSFILTNIIIKLFDTANPPFLIRLPLNLLETTRHSDPHKTRCLQFYHNNCLHHYQSPIVVILQKKDIHYYLIVVNHYNQVLPI